MEFFLLFIIEYFIHIILRKFISIDNFSNNIQLYKWNQDKGIFPRWTSRFPRSRFQEERRTERAEINE